MASEADRLEQITQQIHTILEDRLTQLLADVQAVREVANLVQSTDGEITRRELLKDRLLTRLEASTGADQDDLRRRVASEDEAVSNLTLLRADLVETLAALADELETGSTS